MIDGSAFPTDFGTITVLYSQPVAALQILTKEGQWKWVQHIENALVINAGDALEFLSGGFYKATIHR
jgi:isopenicillin N synthase-like dioxygenase